MRTFEPKFAQCYTLSEGKFIKMNCTNSIFRIDSRCNASTGLYNVIAKIRRMHTTDFSPTHSIPTHVRIFTGDMLDQSFITPFIKVSDYKVESDERILKLLSLIK